MGARAAGVRMKTSASAIAIVVRSLGIAAEYTGALYLIGVGDSILTSPFTVTMRRS